MTQLVVHAAWCRVSLAIRPFGIPALAAARTAIPALALLVASPVLPASPTAMSAPIAYPETRRGDVGEEHERFIVPTKKRGRYFYLHNSGLQNQSVLYVRDSVDGAGRVLIDPNTWSKDGANALAEWAVSSDGKRLAYGVQDGGSDWRTVRVLDVDTGKVFDDEVKWARFTTIEWAKDGAGFFYARYPEPKQDAAFQANVRDHAIYFHKLGTLQAQDRLVHATPEQPVMMNYPKITEDGRYLVINSTIGTPGVAFTVWSTH